MVKSSCYWFGVFRSIGHCLLGCTCKTRKTYKNLERKGSSRTGLQRRVIHYTLFIRGSEDRDLTKSLKRAL